MFKLLFGLFAFVTLLIFGYGALLLIFGIGFFVLLFLTYISYRDFQNAKNLKVSRRICPYCGENNITINTLQANIKSINGGLGRSIGTNYFAGVSTGRQRIEHVHEGICQSCGESFEFITSKDREALIEKTDIRFQLNVLYTVFAGIGFGVMLASML